MTMPGTAAGRTTGSRGVGAD
ncbi:MAG: hypothetical protein RIR52_1324, partial [Acidobacteriota bacterium]